MLLLGLLLLSQAVARAEGCFPNLFYNKTTTNGLGNEFVQSVFADGNVIYAATALGLSISTDEGKSFVTRTTANGLGDNVIVSVFAVGSKVYAATALGLSISTDGGNRFVNKTTLHGLGDDSVLRIFVVGNTVYAATAAGLSISVNGGLSFINKTIANGLGDDYVSDVFVGGSTVYAATAAGLSISTNGGNSFVNRTTANGLGDDDILGVFAAGSNVYAATALGLSISTDGGNSFINKTTLHGLGDDSVLRIFVVGNNVYAVTSTGLSVSTNNGSSFRHLTVEMLGLDALPHREEFEPCEYACGRQSPLLSLLDIYVLGNTIYLAGDGGLAIGTCTNSRPSVQKAGSLLVFPYYVSNAAARTDTRFAISNVESSQVIAHVFFIDGKSCSQADQYVCLTPNASIIFKVSEYDPETTGWLLVVAIDESGNPIQHSGLIGNAFINNGIYVGNYAAQSFQAHSPRPAALNSNGTATLLFDGKGYDGVPSQFTVEIQSPLDIEGQRIVTVGLSGDLVHGQIYGAGQVGSGLVYNGSNAMVNCFCKFLHGSCQAIATISIKKPRVLDGMENLIPSGYSGTIKFNVGAAVGLILTPRPSNGAGIRALHQTTWTTTKLTIPVFRPVC